VSELRLTLVDVRSGHLDRAEGDYVWFVEAAEAVQADLEAITARLEETRPDVLLVDPGQGAPRGSFTVDEWPPALDVAPGLGDKIFRRAFLRELGVGLADREFGELPLTYAALLAAGRIAAWDGGRSFTTPERRSDPTAVFAVYDRVFEVAERLGSTIEGRLRFLPVSMLLHYLTLIGELPEEERTEFFAHMSQSYATWARGDEKVSAERRQEFHARRANLGHGSRGGSAARQIGVLQRVRRRARRAYYARQLRRPVDADLAVFAAYWYTGFACNPRAIYERLGELCPHVRCVWVVDREHEDAIPPGIPYVVAGSREYMRLVARAKWFVNNVGFPEEIVKRDGTIRIHTHHGTPVKTMGLDLRDALVAGSRTDFARQRRRWSRWDYSVTQNRFTTIEWARTYPGTYETLEVGYPRNDVLANSTQEDVHRVRAELEIEPDRVAILYAPTHREFVPGFVSPLDLDRLAKRLGEKYVLLARTHYLQTAPDPGFHGERVRDVSGHPSIEDLFLAADVLVSDYSSMIFDYAVLDRPLIVHVPDWEIYRSLRGTYLDLLAQPPGVVTRTEDDLVDALRGGRAWAEEASALRAAFRARFCSLEDGRAAERVVRAVWLGEPAAPLEGATAPPSPETIGA
jgi:CDP-glycerol glycerophosphotransferase